jgi:isopentenyl-diphosphate Delta-isomerase
MSEVVLVDENDVAIGSMDKMQAHEKGLLHRAFSVFIFNGRGEMLLQQRADKKYHSGGLWTNACCSHPAPGEDTAEAAVRRLKEELGFTTSLKKAFSFTYRTDFENGLTENEFDHVFTGMYEGEIVADTDEVKNYRFASMIEIGNLMQKEPEKFTSWFVIAFPKIEKWWQKNFQGA